LGFVSTPMFRTAGDLCRFCTCTRPTEQTDHPHTRLATLAHVDVRLRNVDSVMKVATNETVVKP
jgi:hypothetical protein